MRRLARALMLLFWFTLPWEAAIRIGGTASLSRAIGVLFALVGIAAVLVAGRRNRPGELVVLMAVLTTMVLASTWWSISPGASEGRSATIVQLLVLVALTWEFAHDEQSVIGLMNAWLGGCVVVALIAGSAFLTDAAQTRYTAPGSSPGDVAYAMLIGIPIAWYLSLRVTRPGLIWAYRLFVPVACLTVVLTASRAGLLTMAVALLVVPLTIRWLDARAWSGIVASVVVVALVSVPLSGGLAAPLARLSTTSSELASGTLDQRTLIWDIGLGIMRDHPVLGVGAGAARNVVSGQFFTSRGLHNTFLSLAAELGFVGLAVFLLMLAVAWYRTLTSLPPLETRVAWVLLVVFLISLSTRHADYDKSTYALLTLFALMGVVLRRSDASSAPPAQRGPAPDSTRDANDRPAGSAS